MEVLPSIIEMVSSSSSNSSDNWDDDYFMRNVMLRPNKKKRVENFVNDVVDKYSDEEFKANFRVNKETANYLIEMFERSEFYKTKEFGGRKGIPARAQILSFLWFAGNKNTYREVANLFHISISTMYRHLKLILEFFFELSAQNIKFPQTEYEKADAANKFMMVTGFPNVLGCIDGCYINIRKPAGKIRCTYTNRHDMLSITLQGICDSTKKFIDVFVGTPSKVHDSRILDLSFIGDKLEDICGPQYHILGDAAYPLREYLLTPYKDCGNLTSKQQNYNLKHSQTRVNIENCFGILKQRFRQLM